MSVFLLKSKSQMLQRKEAYDDLVYKLGLLDTILPCNHYENVTKALRTARLQNPSEVV
jgi:hypothetical protein